MLGRIMARIKPGEEESSAGLLVVSGHTAVTSERQTDEITSP
jgi:hypothetical protein